MTASLEPFPLNLTTAPDAARSLRAIPYHLLRMSRRTRPASGSQLYAIDPTIGPRPLTCKRASERGASNRHAKARHHRVVNRCPTTAPAHLEHDAGVGHRDTARELAEP